MLEIFATAFGATGDPDQGWRLGKRMLRHFEAYKEEAPNPHREKDAQFILARGVLAEVREFADENGVGKQERKPVVCPTVHMNGTGKNTLAEDYDEAREAVRRAIEQIQQIEFNARDYYVQGDGAWEQACAEMKERLLSLQRVSDELLAIMEGIDKQ